MAPAWIEHGDECEPRWQTYPRELVGDLDKNRDNEVIGQVRCFVCDDLIAFGITEREWEHERRKARTA